MWEFDWDGADTVVALVSEDHSGSGWYQAVVARLDLATHTAETLYEPTWQTGSLALSPDGTRAIVVEGYASDHGLLAGSIVVIDLATRTTTDPWPDLQTVGLASWCDDTSLWYARTDGTGNACGRLHLDGRQEERWRDDAFIGDAVTTPACAVTEDAARVWTTHQAHARPPELARFDHATATWERLTGFNDHIVEGRLFPDARTIRWTGEDGDGDRGHPDDASRRRRTRSRSSSASTADPPGTGARTSRTRSPTPCCSHPPATPASSRTRAGASGAATRSSRG